MCKNTTPARDGTNFFFLERWVWKFYAYENFCDYSRSSWGVFFFPKSDLAKWLSSLSTLSESLLDHLERNNWCEPVMWLLGSEDIDVIEKGLTAIQVTMPACGNFFAELKFVGKQLRALQERWENDAGTQTDGDSTSGYFSTLLETVQKLDAELRLCDTTRTCSRLKDSGTFHSELWTHFSTKSRNPTAINIFIITIE